MLYWKKRADEACGLDERGGRGKRDEGGVQTWVSVTYTCLTFSSSFFSAFSSFFSWFFLLREKGGKVTFHLEHVLAFSSHSCVSGGDDPLEDKLTGLLSFTLS